MTITNELEDIHLKAKKLKDRRDEFTDLLESLSGVLEGAMKASSGSWFGYHSCVYYQDLKKPPPGARFDSMSGLTREYVNNTLGDWEEYDYDQIYNDLLQSVDSNRYQKFKEAAESAWTEVENLQQALVSLLSSIDSKNMNEYLEKLLRDAKLATPLSEYELLSHVRPSGKFMSRDRIALSAGVQTPPHVTLTIEAQSLESPFLKAGDISKIAIRAKEHMDLKNTSKNRTIQTGGKVFIGHGRSPVWRDLKDFLQDRLQLPWDEFNRVPVAGITNISRLAQMMNDASVAFILMTAEDEQNDGKIQARMNVIHEVGLFQGRLGFTKAIVVLEEGCEEFSNIQGLGQLRFPKGNISAIYEDIREILEREGLIQ